MNEEVLSFWFEESSPKDWFSKNDDFDKKIKQRFEKVYNLAINGRLDNWKEEAKSCLALIIVLDQFSRNLFRNDKRAYAQDKKSIELTKYALEKGFDKELEGSEKTFLIMPLMHSEELEDQELCVDLFSSLGEEYSVNLKFAEEHRDIIKQFGRFPHRNKDLGRENTTQEEEFLKTHKGF